MGNEDEVAGFTEKEKIILSCLIGWSILHTILFLLSDHYESSSSYFWPFDDEPLRNSYDFSEFAVYCIIPWVVFGTYKLLQMPTKVLDGLQRLNESKFKILRVVFASLTILSILTLVGCIIAYSHESRQPGFFSFFPALIVYGGFGWYFTNKKLN